MFIDIAPTEPKQQGFYIVTIFQNKKFLYCFDDVMEQFSGTIWGGVHSDDAKRDDDEEEKAIMIDTLRREECKR